MSTNLIKYLYYKCDVRVYNHKFPKIKEDSVEVGR